jgi:hypothetical protein
MARNIISMTPAAVREGHVRRLEKDRRPTAALRFVPALAPVRLVKPDQNAPKLTAEQRRLNEAARKAERFKLAVLAGDALILSIVKRLNNELDVCVWPLDEGNPAGSFVVGGWIFDPEWLDDTNTVIERSVTFQLWLDTVPIIRVLRDALNRHPISALRLRETIGGVRERWLGLAGRKLSPRPNRGTGGLNG